MKMKLVVFIGLMMLTSAAFADFDFGDLLPCNYPTSLQFGPMHSLTGKAWLGPCITSEVAPHDLNADGCDDGVVFVGYPWTPCEIETLIVTIHGGPNYNQVVDGLWLNAWKDGNLDYDFCDTLCEGLADEWIIQDFHYAVGELAPNTDLVDTFYVLDPGVLDMGVYDGVFRFRLSGHPLGREGFGYAQAECDIACGAWPADSLGEVEDYWQPDFQLPVSLNGFDAVPGDNQVSLSWATASEVDNDHFEIVRNGSVVQRVSGAGNSVTAQNYAWLDNNVVNGTSYSYALIAVDLHGSRDEIARVEGVTPSPSQAVVTEYALHQNFPNPFNPSTSITFDLLESGNVSLRVFNMIGQEVATLVNGNMSSGRHAITFDAAELPTGLYLYRLEANGFTDQKKMLLIK